LHQQVDGAQLEFEAMSYYVIVATAGHDTTSSNTGRRDAGLVRTRPVRLCEDRTSRGAGFIDEAIWTTPSQGTFMRSATASQKVGGQANRQG